MRAPRLHHEFDTLYREHYDFVWRSALRVGVPRAQLDDVLQETFLVAYRRLAQFEGRSKTSTWLFGILRNVWRNHQRGQLRSTRKHLALERESVRESFGAGAELDAERTLGYRLLADFVTSLEPTKREVFVLGALEGMNRREIAAALGINPNTAHSRLRGAQAAFERHFDGEQHVLAACDGLRSRPARASAEQRARSHSFMLAALGPKLALTAKVSSSLGLASLITTSFALIMTTIVALELAARRASTSTLEPSSSVAPRLVDRGDDSAGSSIAQPQVEASALERPRAQQDEQQDSPVVRAPGDTSNYASGYATFEAAREALVDDRPADALRLVQTLDKHGVLGWQRAVTEISSLCRLDRREQAFEVAADWNQSDPRQITVPCP